MKFRPLNGAFCVVYGGENVIIAEQLFGVMDVMCYFYIDDETRCGFLIDPGADAERIFTVIKEKNITIEKILLTHGHYDHIGAANEIREKLKIPIFMHENGKYYAENPLWNLSKFMGNEMTLDDVELLKDGSIISLTKNPDFSVKLIAAPGHTHDGAIYYSEKDGVAFVGDTIFKHGYGRTDFYGGDSVQLLKTLRETVFTLPPKTVLLSGHSEPTTVSEEKQYFL